MNNILIRTNIPAGTEESFAHRFYAEQEKVLEYVRKKKDCQPQIHLLRSEQEKCYFIHIVFNRVVSFFDWILFLKENGWWEALELPTITQNLSADAAEVPKEVPK